MVKIVLNVEGMECEHCVEAVETAVAGLDGISSVVVDLDSNTATIEHDPTVSSVEKIVFAIEEQGYDVVI
ncbi:MAG: copper ion binding protein [Peptococcaceae bacterium]|nr:copper ion binding protein [Peptococcaceae bacterium]